MWLHDDILNHFHEEVNNNIHYLFMDGTSEEEIHYRNQGYIPFKLKFPNKKLGIPVGTMVWYHPQNKDIIPMSVGQFATPQPVTPQPKVAPPMPKKEVIMPFGAHKNKSLDKIPTSYLQWCLTNIKDLNPQLKQNIQQVIDSRNTDEQSPSNSYKPKSNQAQQPSSPSINNNAMWICGLAKANFDGSYLNMGSFKIGEKIVAKKVDLSFEMDADELNHYGDYDENAEYWKLLTNKFEPIYMTRENIAKYITSVNDANGAIKKVTTPEEFLGPDPSKKVKPNVKPGHEDIVYNNLPTPEEVRIPRENMTEYNVKIEERFLSGIDETTGKPANIVINALAGTGKTTMLKHLSSFKKPGERWLYLVFNRRNRDESIGKFPQGIDIKTTHSYLDNMLKKSGREVGGGTELPPEKSNIVRVREILDHMVPLDWPETPLSFKDRKTQEWMSPFHKRAKRVVLEIVNKAKAYALNPSDNDLEQQLMDLINRLKIDMDVSTEKTLQDRDYTPDILEKAIETLHITMPNALPNQPEWASLKQMRDHDDTLWYAALYADELRWNANPKYDVILLDEVQDFNRCQIIMTQKLQQSGARVVAVGDPNQSMYLFRGADATAFTELQPMLSPGHPEMDLPINFRSGGNIIEFVKNNSHVKNLKCSPNKEGQGEVRTDASYDEFINIIQQEHAKNNGTLEQGTAILSRNNANLTDTAITLLKSGIDFQLIGTDLYDDIELLAKKVIKAFGSPRANEAKMRETHIDDFGWKLGDYVENLNNKWGNKVSKQDELQELTKYSEAIYTIMDYLKTNNWQDPHRPHSEKITNLYEFMEFLKIKIGGVDADDHNAIANYKKRDPRTFVSLMTAHKSKGLEFDRVCVLNPEDFSDSNPKIKTAEEAQQERNCWYVALTRAQNSLFVTSKKGP